MMKWTSMLAAIVVALGLAGAAQAHEVPEDVELRGMWASFAEEALGGTRETIDAGLDKAQRMGINALYVSVWYDTPRWITDEFPGGPKEGDFDKVAYLIQAAHNRGMQVHGWFHNGKRWGAEAGKPPADWFDMNAQGERKNFYDWSKPEVRDYQVAFMTDFLEHHPEVDGLHFDFIRTHQRGDWLYSPYARQQFAREHAGVDPMDLVKNRDKFEPAELARLDRVWLQWRKDQITQVVKRVSKAARRMKPDVLMTAAVRNFPSGVDNAKQAWPEWVEAGYLDYAIPMYYENDAKTYQQLVDWYRRIGDEPFNHVVPSLGAWQGTGVNPGESSTGDPQQALACWKIGQEAGAHGAVFFWLGGVSDEYISTFANGPFSGPAKPYVPPKH